MGVLELWPAPGLSRNVLLEQAILLSLKVSCHPRARQVCAPHQPSAAMVEDHLCRIGNSVTVFCMCLHV